MASADQCHGMQESRVKRDMIKGVKHLMSALLAINNQIWIVESGLVETAHLRSIHVTDAKR